jgi:hypothetical protein
VLGDQASDCLSVLDPGGRINRLVGSYVLSQNLPEVRVARELRGRIITASTPALARLPQASNQVNTLVAGLLRTLSVAVRGFTCPTR